MIATEIAFEMKLQWLSLQYLCTVNGFLDLNCYFVTVHNDISLTFMAC